MIWHPLLDQLRARRHPPDLFGLVDEEGDQGRDEEIAIGKQSEGVRLDRAHGGKDAQDPKLDHVVLQSRSSVETRGVVPRTTAYDRITGLGMPRPEIAA